MNPAYSAAPGALFATQTTPFVIIFAPLSISRASLGICWTARLSCARSVVDEKVNWSHSCPAIVWVWPVATKVTASSGMAGAGAAWARNRSTSNT